MRLHFLLLLSFLICTTAQDDDAEFETSRGFMPYKVDHNKNAGKDLGSPKRLTAFKQALIQSGFGTTAGVIVAKDGKPTINNATAPFTFSGNDHYFDQRNYNNAADFPRCSIPMFLLVNPDGQNRTDVDHVLSSLQFRDGSKPVEIFWTCKKEQVCCGIDCCPSVHHQK